MAQRWLPNYGNFFHSLGRLIETCERQTPSQRRDAADFYLRRVDEYERTLSVLLSRLTESYRDMPFVLNSFYHIRLLCFRLGELREELQYLSSVEEDDEFNELGRQQANFHPDVRLNHIPNLPGRPRVQITQDQLDALSTGAGFSWNDIARILQVSSRTLRRRRHAFGMPVDGKEFTALTNFQLDGIIREVLGVTPAAGLRLVQGSLHARGLRVQRARVLQSLRRVDPVSSTLRNSRQIIRRKYTVASPNSLWHIDGNHKLIEPYRIVIHGAIDGYSRLITYLHASTDNRAGTVLQLFLSAAENYNLPSRVRCDLGLENLEVGRYMLQNRGINRGSVITGTSVHNQRIERLWRDVNRVVVSRFLNIFLYLESSNVFVPSNETHLFVLQMVYVDLVNMALRHFSDQWNSHPVSTETNYSPRQLWIAGMVSQSNSRCTAVQDIVNQINYGVDESGPVPLQQQNYEVFVTQSPIHLSDLQVQQVKSQIQTLEDENGITQYLVALQMVTAMLAGED